MNTEKISSGYDWLLRRSVLILQAGLTALIWISMPFALISLRAPLYFVGIIASVAIFSGLIIRVPLTAYIQKAGINYFQSMCLIFNGLALIILSISRTILDYTFGFVILSMSTSMFLLSVKTRDYRGTIAAPLTEMFSLELWGTVGVFAILSLAAVFTGPISEMYSIFSIVAIAAGLFGFFSRKDKSTGVNPTVQNIPFRNYLRMPFAYLKAFDSLKNKKVAYLIVASNLGVFASVAMTVPFISSIGVLDSVSERMVFFAFAIFSVYAFAISYFPRKFINQALGKMLYFIRPIMLLLPLLLFSMANMPFLFISGFALIGIWMLMDTISARFLPVGMEESEKDYISKIETVFRIPFSFLIPLLSSYLWLLSPRFVFALALAPLSLSVVISFIFEDRISTGERVRAKKLQEV